MNDARRRDAADLTDDLLFMRKGSGFTAKRIVNAGTLRHVLGGGDEPFDNLRDRFISAIQSLRDPEPDLLLAAYGLAPGYGDLPMLRQRRERYGHTIDRKVDTVADREDAAIEHLRVQLLTGWYTQSPVSARIPEMHNGIIQESVHVSTLVVDRKWQQTREHYRFMALFDEADYIAISSSYPGRPIPEGDFTVKTVRVGQNYSHQFWHNGPMKRGRTYDLRFRLVPDDDYGQPEAIIEEARAFHERTLTATIEVEFHGPTPEQIWSYERLTYFERPGSPRHGRILDPSEGNVVRSQTHDQYGGLFTGIAWNWRTETQ
ncbi:hypothetical protein [Nocardia farcinica]|uniref:hypothetical protein n=1 Tax=Nocardia farcinica TaxID=37329 RepID=UPI0024581A39|nr:hypothetical protein [Nocardia farcinica]